MNAPKWENHPSHRDLWLKENKHAPWGPKEKWEKYFAPSCALVTALTQRCFLSTRCSLIQVCTCWVVTPGQVLPVSQSRLLPSWDHLRSSPLDLHLSFSTLFFFTAQFYGLFSSSLHFQSQNLLFVFYRWASCACFSTNPYCGESFACGLELVSGEVLRLMQDGSGKLAIISAAWIQVQEQ